MAANTKTPPVEQPAQAGTAVPARKSWAVRRGNAKPLPGVTEQNKDQVKESD
ncbi:hypothetical protein [Ferrimonas pelagia]|uniref:Uncharacterized protein n=1 Tax=Ferrimonas pelagia TaxID=1177826 RepID=A0ABP9EL05_9GAMM